MLFLCPSSCAPRGIGSHLRKWDISKWKKGFLRVGGNLLGPKRSLTGKENHNSPMVVRSFYTKKTNRHRVTFLLGLGNFALLN